MATETTIQSEILEYLNSLPHCEAENQSGNAVQHGRPDINGCYCGTTLRLEVKTEDTAYGRKGATTDQELNLKCWARAGAISAVVYSLGDVKQLIWMICQMKHGVKGFTLIKTSGRGVWYDVSIKGWAKIQN